MTKQVIAVDIDDVLAQGTESLRLEVNKRLGVDLQPEQYAIAGEYANYYEQVWEANGLGGKITMAELEPRMITDQSHVPVFEKARGVLQKLSTKYRLIVVTARNPSWETATKQWLESHFPGAFDGVYFAGHRNHSETKGELCARLGADWLIDDNVSHAETALTAGLRVILFGDYGWHKGASIHEDIVRCKDWAAVLEYFDGIG